VDKVIHILSTCITFKKSRKLKLYTKLSTLSTFYVCGILDVFQKTIYITEKETNVLCKMINPHFTTEKIKNLLTFLYSKNHIILHAKDKIKDYI
jgi:hypothetical protein